VYRVVTVRIRTGTLLAIVCACLIAATFAACGGKNEAAQPSGSDSTSIAAAEGSMESEAENFGEGEGQGEGEEPKKQRERSTTVRVSSTFTGDLVKPVVAEGTIRARHSAEIRVEVGGKITRLFVDEGRPVRGGQLIAKVDDRGYRAAADEARARYLQALSLLSIEEENPGAPEEAVQAVRDELANLEKLERSGKITAEERQAREIELDVQALKEGKFHTEIAAARSGVSVARTALERARLDLERTEIRVPFDGVITGLKLSVGQLVTVGENVCTIVDNVNVEAEVGVLEADLAFVAEGKPVLLAIPALRDTLSVQVDVVSPQFDREARTCEVLIRLKDPTGRVRPGMFVRALIAGETFDDRLLVPREAILNREGRPLLFKVEDGRAKWLYVELGESNADLVEITQVLQGGALSPGDQVVVSDHLTLTHDAKVKVKSTVPIKDPWAAPRKVEE